MRMYRQGDLLIAEIEELPAGLKQKDKVLAYGEATGHKHQFLSEQALVFCDDKQQQFLKLSQECELVHEEHETIAIPAGVYRVVQQREYDFLEGIRQVAD